MICFLCFYTLVDKDPRLILDGEMLVYDPSLDRYLPFGNLKTAALGPSHNISVYWTSLPIISHDRQVQQTQSTTTLL